jgi:syntaxin 8
MSAAAERLHLLHEHIRLSLVERKRALASGAEPNSRTVHEISRSLDTLARGIEQLEREQRQLDDDPGAL